MPFRILHYIRKFLVQLFNVIYWLDRKASDRQDKYRLERHEHCEHEAHQPERQDPDGPPEDTSMMEVRLNQVYFGQVVVECPECHFETEEVAMGLATIEREYDESDPDKDSGLPNMIQVGIILYPCGHSLNSSTLTEKVSKILNAREEGHLKPSMIADLASDEV